MSTEPTAPALVDAKDPTDRNGRPMGAQDRWAREMAMDVLQAIADSLPDDDTIGAQELLAGTPYERMYCLNGSVIENYVHAALSNAFYDGLLALAAPPAPAVLAEGEREAIASLIYKAHGQVYERRPFSGGAPIPFADLINRKRRGFLATADAVLALLRAAPSLPMEESVSTHEAARAHVLLDRFKQLHGLGIPRQAPSGHENDLVARIQWALSDAEDALNSPYPPKSPTNEVNNR